MSLVPTPQVIDHDQRHSVTHLQGLQALAAKSTSSIIPPAVPRDQSSDKESILSTRVPSLRASESADVPSDTPRRRSIEAERSSHLEPFDGIHIGETTAELSGLPAAAGLSTAPSLAIRRKELAYLLAMCAPMFLNGWNDSSPGPMLPRLQSHYGIGYVVASTIFLANAIGAVTAAITNMWLSTRFGLGITVALAATSHAISYAIQATKPPFPIFVLSFLFTGYGEGLFDAQTNSLVALLPTNPNAKLSLLHASYGVGAFTSPLISTRFSNMPVAWHYYFLVSMGLAIAVLGILIWVTKLKHQDTLLHEIGVHPEEETIRAPMIRQVMELKVVHILAFFVLLYTGMEVTIGGWMVTFVQRRRHGGSSAGYVSSGFFGGLTVGRVALIGITRKVGLQRVLYFYTLIAIALEFTIWFVPSLYENAIAVALVGVVIGPFFPIVVRVMSILVPRRVLTGAVGWVASIARMGSAVFPFALAVMAEKYGVQVLQPLIVAMLSAMLGAWFFVPPIPRHSD
ncbi:MFS general substrate transporter [Clavulina sp. PMI_390]|nr:MFS general substrate transporter [Clavulina sp. PMI_390]